MSEFFEFNYTKVDEDKAELESSASIISAIRHVVDCDFVELLVRKEGEVLFEYVICDISSDEIPSRNEYGIEYRERIAFVFGSTFKLPITLALRKGFPETMHQNFALQGTPKDLCLYEEQEGVTQVSWTPERHIRRAKWWLIQASHGRLHADDQAVEQLLYNPSATIVIPNDLASGLKQGRKVVANLIQDSGVDTERIFLRAEWKKERKQSGTNINLLEILTPKVTHGSVYSSPFNFSDLASLMESLSIDVVELLRARLLTFLRDKEGDFSAPTTALVFTMPIRRSESTAPEREQVIGFFCKKSVQQMLLELEVVVKENELINQDFMGNLYAMTSQPPDFTIIPMEVLKTTNSAIRRAQSGYLSDLRKGVLIGAGALGGSLLDIWVRGGWGQWTVVDEDIFRPHNFTRHVADTWGMGHNKAIVAANAANFKFEGVGVTAIADNACDFSNKELKDSFSSAELVIDASASLDYPREVSAQKHAPRHLSAFFSPSGNDAVLLVEDKRRKTRLSSLEAQYYRALTELSVGERHLTLGVTSFRSGVSCRDLSTVMSHARVLSLSSLLADQIRFASEQDDAQIRIWQDDLNTGCRSLTEVVVYKTKTNVNHTGSEFQVFWDEGIETKVRTLREAALPNETGGILVGYHDMVRKSVFIVDALPEPADSIGKPTSFVRGTEGIVDTLLEISNRTANNVGYIGEWHSHPNGAPANMSGLDRIQLAELAERLLGDGLAAYQMIVAKNEIKVHEKGVMRD